MGQSPFRALFWVHFEMPPFCLHFGLTSLLHLGVFWTKSRVFFFLPSILGFPSQTLTALAPHLLRISTSMTHSPSSSSYPLFIKFLLPTSPFLRGVFLLLPLCSSPPNVVGFWHYPCHDQWLCKKRTATSRVAPIFLKVFHCTFPTLAIQTAMVRPPLPC